MTYIELHVKQPRAHRFRAEKQKQIGRSFKTQTSTRQIDLLRFIEVNEI